MTSQRLGSLGRWYHCAAGLTCLRRSVELHAGRGDDLFPLGLLGRHEGGELGRRPRDRARSRHAGRARLSDPDVHAGRRGRARRARRHASAKDAAVLATGTDDPATGTDDPAAGRQPRAGGRSPRDGRRLPDPGLLWDGRPAGGAARHRRGTAATSAEGHAGAIKCVSQVLEAICASRRSCGKV
jgi:hypothetical protein